MPNVSIAMCCIMSRADLHRVCTGLQVDCALQPIGCTCKSATHATCTDCNCLQQHGCITRLSVQQCKGFISVGHASTPTYTYMSVRRIPFMDILTRRQTPRTGTSTRQVRLNPQHLCRYTQPTDGRPRVLPLTRQRDTTVARRRSVLTNYLGHCHRAGPQSLWAPCSGTA
jgi:hypothetical protein